MTDRANSNRGQRNVWKWALGILVIAVVAGGLFMRRQTVQGASESDAAANAQITSVAFKGDLENSVSSNGNLMPSREAHLTFSMNGEVEVIEVAVGDMVEMGDTLMVLDSAVVERAVEDAELMVTIRQADVDALDTADLIAAEERVADAEATLEAAVDEAAIAAAETDLEAAQAALDTVGNDQLAYSRTIAESQLAQAENALEAAVASLEAATLTAPFDGVISQINVDVGAFANGVVLSMFDPDSLVVTLDIDEIDLLELEAGTDATLTIDALPGVNLDGTVSQIAIVPSANMSDRVTYSVEVELDTHEEALRYGMSAQVRLTTAERDTVLLVPNEAITFNGDDGTYFVTLVEDNVNVRAKVEIGIRDRQFTEIESGLSSGDEVVVRVNTVPESDLPDGPGPFGN